jgi:hypothetical protein
MVFGALLVIDTAALLRLGWYCVTGGCGVPPTWIAIGGGALALGAWLLVRPRTANVKIAKVRKAGPPRASRGKAVARGKTKKAK